MAVVLIMLVVAIVAAVVLVQRGVITLPSASARAPAPPGRRPVADDPELEAFVDELRVDEPDELAADGGDGADRVADEPDADELEDEPEAEDDVEAWDPVATDEPFDDEPVDDERFDDGRFDAPRSRGHSSDGDELVTLDEVLVEVPADPSALFADDGAVEAVFDEDVFDEEVFAEESVDVDAFAEGSVDVEAGDQPLARRTSKATGAPARPMRLGETSARPSAQSRRTPTEVRSLLSNYRSGLQKGRETEDL